MRKLFAVVAAAATLIGGAVFGAATAVADGTATITIENAQQGHTYKAYKVATFSNVKLNGDVITSMDVNTESGDNLRTVLTTAIEKAGTTIPDEYTTNPMAFVATFDAATARKFADYFVEGTTGLPASLESKTIPDEGAAPGSDVMNVPEGWYLITDSKDGANFKTALVASTVQGKTKFTTVQTGEQQALNGTLGAFYVKNENAPSIPEKHAYVDNTYTTIKTGSVNIGDTLYYQVRTSVPKAATGRDDYTITFKDAAANGLNIAQENNISVCHKAKTASDGAVCVPVDAANVTITQSGDAAAGTVTTVVVSGVSAYVGEYVYLRYSATVTADVLGTDGTGRVLHNEATVRHADGDESDAGEANLYVGDLKFYKYAIENNAEVKLSGVEFTVHRGESATAGTEGDLKFSLENPDVKGVYKYDPVQGSTTVSTGENGVLLLKGLEAGKYTFVETKPIEGYTENFKPTFTVDMSVVPNRGIAANAPMIQNPLTDDNNGWKLASDWTDPTDNCERAKVKNVKSLTQLPLTGGAGIILFSVIAALLIAVAAIATVRIRAVKRELQA